MLPIADIDQIQTRAAAINLSLKRLARMAGVHPTAPYRALRRKTDMRVRSVRRLLEALERQENRMRQHLRDLECSGGGRC